MTIETKIFNMLVESYMMEDEAREVINEAKKLDYVSESKFHWGDDASGYPPQFLGALWLVVKQCALEYIDKNHPKAFYRECFV